ncbi:MAG TPA: hypothetical protein GX008_09785 [Firmicutes bacterium]|nr:MAG: hypothetical protein AA931_07905 [Peptococcaceae bacterium 1109]HHT73991.1 hypothetical protein [Bacillota bacterium]
MKIQRFIPFLVVAVIAGALAYGQGWLQPKQSPKTGEEIRSQVATPGNRLEDLRRLDLEIELVNDREVKLTYAASGDQDPRAAIRRGDRPDEGEITGQEAVDQIEAIAGAIPPLPADEPLTLIQAVLDQLAIAQTDVREFEFEYVLTDDSRGVVELQVKDHNDDDWDDDGGRDDS